MRTRKQTPCTHPPAHVHATFDDRWETCDLCHIVRPRPLPAPWIVAHDENLPTEEPPALFGQAQAAPAAALVVPVPTVADELTTCPRCQGKRRVMVQPIFPNDAPPARMKCPRCQGAGHIAAYHVHPAPTAAQKAKVIA